MTKKCNKCGIIKNKEDFCIRPDRAGGQGLYFQCKNCKNEYNKQWKLNNLEIVKKNKREYCAKRYKTDPNFKIIVNLRIRINKAIKKSSKSATTKDLLGCEIESLKGFLESQFVENMNWENYGEWHIDHVIPCAAFDLSKPEEQRKCFHYTNLQPLWAKDNILKSNKI